MNLSTDLFVPKKQVLDVLYLKSISRVVLYKVNTYSNTRQQQMQSLTGIKHK